MAAMSIFRGFYNGGARRSQLLGSGILQNACKSGFSDAVFSRAVSSSTKSENLSGIMQGKKTEKNQPHGIGSTARMRIVIKSANPNFPRINSGPYTSKVSLPMKRKLYTVLRSPHIDKKSREQFEMRIYKEIIDIETTTPELAKKLFWFKRQKLIGAQYGFIFNYKTRLQLPGRAPSTTANEDTEESLSDLEEKVKHLVQATVGSETFGEGTEEQQK